MPSIEVVRSATSTGMVYERRGAGSPIILIHGWCLNRKMWMYAQEAFASSHLVVTPDLPGLGDSDGLAGPYSLKRFAAEIGRLVEELDLTGVVLVGFAFGAMVALEFVSQANRRIAGVVSVGLPGAEQSPYAKMPKAMRRDWPDFARRSAEALFFTPQSAASISWLESLFRAAPLPVALETVEILASYDPVSAARRSTAPLLLIHADKDTVAPRSIGESCAAAAPNARLEVIEDCGHLIVLDQKAAFHATTLAFVASCGPAGTQTTEQPVLSNRTMSQPASTLVNVETQPGIQIWRMNSAPVNALSPALLAELNAKLDAAIADSSIAAIVLTSDLRVFSAGADASWMTEVLNRGGPEGLVDEFNAAMDIFREFCIRLRRAPILIVAALNGHTLAGGLELAAACDLRFASDVEKIQIGVPEMDLFGVMPSGGGGAQFIAKLMGSARALQFILDAKPVSPSQALQHGLVERLCPPDTLQADAAKFAGDVARKAGRIGVAAAKTAIFGGADLPFSAAMDLDRSIHWDCMRRGNFKAGAAAFAKKFG